MSRKDEEESYEETVRQVVLHPMSDAKNGARALIISKLIMSCVKRGQAHKARAKGRKTIRKQREDRTANAAKKTNLVHY